MHRDQFRQIVSDQVQKTLSEKGVAISAIPAAEMQSLVEAISDGVFSALVATLEEDDATAAKQPATSAAPTNYTDDETLLWRGRPYLTLGTIYELTTARLRVIRGLLSNNIEELELVRVRDTKMKQSATERLLDIGDITVVSADATTPEIMLRNVRNPLEVREKIRSAVLRERERRGLRYREEFSDSESDV
jgi:hypothetical protein